MQELEKLLNSLIKRGWKPAGFQGKSEIKISEDQGVVLYMTKEDVTLAVKVKLRNLVSLESGLWQFVCKNKLHKKTDNFWENVSKTSTNIWWFNHNHQYRLLESALIPEEELGKFLVDNIRINESLWTAD